MKNQGQILHLFQTLLLCISVSVTTFYITTNVHFAHPSPLTSLKPLLPHQAANLARKTPLTWLRHLRSIHPTSNVTTIRLGCREYTMGVQACVYEGVVCVNVSKSGPEGTRGAVYFVDDSKKDGEEVPSDKWCSYRHYSVEPWYYGARHWPIWKDTIAPQMSCLVASYRTTKSLFGKRLPENANVPDRELLSNSTVKWLQSLWFMDMEYPKTNHNNDFIIDAYWLLDVQLFQESLSLQASPALPTLLPDTPLSLFGDGPRHIYTPQTERQFVFQSSRDVNRLVWALVLQQDAAKLYPNHTAKQLRSPPSDGSPRWTSPLLEVFPKFKKKERFLFHGALRDDPNVDLVCTSHFTAGPKRYDGAHERVCRTMRDRGYKLFGVPYPPMVAVGKVRYPRPPKRITILQRHISREIRNIDELYAGLKAEFERYDVEVEIVTTATLRTAEEFVRVFARAGVLITSHGSQNMGQIWMPRHSTLVEIMPVGFNNYAFRLLARSCEVWYHEMNSLRNQELSKEYYDKTCAKFTPHLLNSCYSVNHHPPIADVAEAIRISREALERMGHPLGVWMDNVKTWRPKGNRMKRQGKGNNKH